MSAERVNAEVLQSLIDLARDDADSLELVYDAIVAFADYHRGVIAEQAVTLVYGRGGVSAAEYLEKHTEADDRRTRAHNNVISKVGQLNRLATSHGLPPVYAGIVSRDQPYRREVADAVFGYLQSIVARRS